MARVKKVVETVEETVTDEVINEVANDGVKEEVMETTNDTNKDEEIDSLKSQLEESKKAMEQMQQMMMQLQQNILLQQSKPVVQQSRSDENIGIVSYAWGKLALHDASGSTIVSFEDSYEEEIIPYSAMKSIMTSKNKNEFFKTGLVGFVDDKYYKEEGIVKPFVLSEENIKELYTLDYEECYKKIKSIIGGNDRVKISLLWQTLRLLAKEEIKNSSVARNIIREVFKVNNIDSAVGQVNLLKDRNYIH